MVDKIFRSVGVAVATVLLLVVAIDVPVSADDTEMYRAEYSAASGASRPKVLLVFDDSGSMNGLIAGQRPEYDPTETYNGGVTGGRIYWSTDGSVPSASSNRYFPASVNRCAASYTSLDDSGRFTPQRARRWVDSTIEQGQCSYECPAGTTYRNPPGPNNAGCYTQQTTSEPVAKLVYVRNDWSNNKCYNGLTYVDPPGGNNDACYEWQTSAGPLAGWIYRRNDSNNNCPSGESRLIVDPPGGNNSYDACFEYKVDPELEESTDWVYDSDRTQVCEPDTEVPGSWQPLSSSDRNPTHVECVDDVNGVDNGNGPGQADGFPQDNVSNGNEYGPVIDGSIDWGDSAYTFYTSHYMNWYHDDSLTEDRTKLAIAQEVVSTLIDTNTSIDFGLMEFNRSSGGRVVQRIIEGMDTEDRENMVAIIDSMDHAGATPMCETMYEAYNYLAGEDTVYADSADSGSDSRGEFDVPPKDASAELSGTYISPLSDCAFTYIILMTDGFPSSDTGANSAIKTLTGQEEGYDCSDYEDADGDMTETCLPELAQYMANTDLDGDDSNGQQLGITYTIGFQTDQQLLLDTAENGKGTYYTAEDAQQLTEAFQGAITSILATESTFTSPAVAVDSFTRTRSRNEVFYAMFKPDSSVDWRGNIKKLELSIDDDEAVLVDAAGESAIDPTTGDFLPDTITFWGDDTEDSGTVDQGGVGALLALRDPDTRNIYIDTGENDALEEFNTTNITAESMGLSSDAELYLEFGASNATAFEKQIAWARGEDSYDKDGDDITDEARNWILGDIMHSQPLVVNYGARGDYDEEDPELRLVVGTNSGFVHMFDNADGSESWAFFPKELAGILPERRRDALSDDHVYGMDLSPVAFTNDVDSDGTLDGSAAGVWGDDEDDVWIFQGMRRGGYSYYALNVSDPDSPSMMWRISPDSTGFGELGQTWSEPVVTKIPGHVDSDGKPKPVLVFGAGYDTNKDSKSGVGSADSMGRGIFIVDAETGALVWSITPGADSTTNLRELGLLHSVPGRVTPLDSNGDRLTDRIYFADTGGNIWRVDLPGLTLRGSDEVPWQITQLADLNPNSSIAATSDRRFFNAPDVVRVRFKDSSVDAVLIGSGDRTNPNGTDVDNHLYMIRDKAITTYSTARPTTSECAEETTVDFRCELPLGQSDLFDASSDLLNSESETVRTAALELLRNSDGWHIELPNAGEKSLAQTIVVDGTIYAPTFTPSNLLNDINMCEPQSGTGQLYVIDLYTVQREVINLGPILPDTPSLHFADDGQIRLIMPPGTPAYSIDEPGVVDCTGGICDVDETLPPPYGNYWFQEGY